MPNDIKPVQKQQPQLDKAPKAPGKFEQAFGKAVGAMPSTAKQPKPEPKKEKEPYEDKLKGVMGLPKEYTREELKDKYGTDNTDIINAGNEEPVKLKKDNGYEQLLGKETNSDEEYDNKYDKLKEIQKQKAQLSPEEYSNEVNEAFNLDRIYKIAGGDEDKMLNIYRDLEYIYDTGITNSDIQSVVEVYMDKKTGKDLPHRMYDRYYKK